MDNIGYAIVTSDNYSRINDTVYNSENEAIEALNDYITKLGFKEGNIKVMYGYSSEIYITKKEDIKWNVASINKELEELQDSYKLNHITKERYLQKKKILTDKKNLIKSGKCKWENV